MESMERHYTLLGVQPDAELTEVEEAYKKKLERYKSDYYSDDPAYARKRCRELDKAYKAIRSSRETEHNWVAVKDEYLDAARQAEEEKQKRLNGEVDPSQLTKGDLIQIEANKRKKRDAKIGGILIAIIILPFFFLPYDPPEEFNPKDYVYITDYPDALSKDVYIAEVALAAKEYIEEYAIDHPRINIKVTKDNYVGRDQSRILNKFVFTYWQKTDISGVANYLAKNYDGYTCDSGYAIDYYDNAIYAFYGFMNLEEIAGYLDPFNKRHAINTWDEMLRYYTKFYEKYSKEHPYKVRTYNQAD